MLATWFGALPFVQKPGFEAGKQATKEPNVAESILSSAKGRVLQEERQNKGGHPALYFGRSVACKLNMKRLSQKECTFVAACETKLWWC